MKKGLANAALLLLATGLALALAEGAVRGLDLFADARATTRVAAATPDEAVERPLSRLAPHPYRGWVLRPGSLADPMPEVFADGETVWFREQRRSNLFGHQSSLEDYRALDGEALVVGLFGGSVANDLAVVAGDVLLEELARLHPGAPGAIRLVNFAQGGYKQPQQLLALVEALLLGVPLDVVVNLDGFNELALGERDAANGFHPFFPRRPLWAAALELTRAAPTRAETEATLAVLRERERAAHWQSLPRRHDVLGRLELARALAGRMAQAAEHRATISERDLGRRMASATRELANLPASCSEPPENAAPACLILIADLWRDSSRMMALLAREHGASYLHLLQPNQYLEGSKPLSDEERRVAFDPDHPWRPAIVAGYPLLRERGAELRAFGVDFVDLVNLFADHEETLYRDVCCHLDLSGNRLLAREVASRVAAALAARRDHPRPIWR